MDGWRMDGGWDFINCVGWLIMNQGKADIKESSPPSSQPNSSQVQVQGPQSQPQAQVLSQSSQYVNDTNNNKKPKIAHKGNPKRKWCSVHNIVECIIISASSSSHLIHLISSHLISSHLISSHLISSHLILIPSSSRHDYNSLWIGAILLTERSMESTIFSFANQIHNRFYFIIMLIQTLQNHSPSQHQIMLNHKKRMTKHHGLSKWNRWLLIGIGMGRSIDWVGWLPSFMLRC